MVYLRSSYSSLPENAGVYRFLDKENSVLYVGKAKNLKARVSSYFVNSGLLGNKTRVLVDQIDKIKVTIVESELEALLLEAFYIKKFHPKYNIRFTDNKSYIKIRITIKDKYPKVLLARREEDPGSVYFGPYPSSSSVRLVLKLLRRVFPYQSVPNHPKRICLYNHLNLCPCPQVNDSPELYKAYKKNIRGLIKIFEGGSKKIMKELENARDKASEKENFEESLLLQKKIEALSIITSPFHKPFEYDVNPNLRMDLRQQELDGLMDVLNDQGFTLKQLQRVECYDISNIQGTNATASMVVFVNGEKDSSQYRKFKIRKDGKPNDFAMMKEVLKRRLRHDDWNQPDLIIVDGGKGQVNAALHAMAESGIVIPLVGLAKREETIVIPTSEKGNTEIVGTNSDGIKTYLQLLNYRFMQSNEKQSETLVINENNFTEVSFPKNSSSLHLLQRIRDEAHRFAITYHKKLRSKNAFV